MMSPFAMDRASLNARQDSIAARLDCPGDALLYEGNLAKEVCEDVLAKVNAPQRLGPPAAAPARQAQRRGPDAARRQRLRGGGIPRVHHDGGRRAGERARRPAPSILPRP